MKEKPCRCGTSKKRFKVDIGPFYIDDCCTEAGFDHKGNHVWSEGETVGPMSATQDAELDDMAAQLGSQKSSVKLSSASALKALIGMKSGRGKLRDMTRDSLLKMAAEKGLKFSENVTKNELIALILT